MLVQPIPGVVFQPDVAQGIRDGVNQLVHVVRPTLGPCPRTVMVEHTFRDKTPEILDNAGVITRRIIQLPDREADIGAMLLRHALWRVQEEAGDATATAAVLFGAIYNRSLPYLASGGNAMQLRRALEHGLEAILEELDRATLPITGKARLADLAESLCFDQPLAQVLGEVFDIVGAYGQVEIRSGNGRVLERQYIEGMYWPSSVLSPHMFVDQTKLRADLTNAAIVMTDLEIDDPRQLMPMLDLALEQKIQTLVLVANKLSDPAIALLLGVSRDPERFRAIAIRTPGTGTVEQATVLEDLALLCGGRPFLQAAGDSLRTIKAAHAGHARRAWVDRTHFGITGGKGDPRALRQHIARLRGLLTTLTEVKPRTDLQQRIGKLMGGSATVLIGGNTQSELTAREELARKTVTLLRAALADGVLPGGGLALLQCRARLRAMRDASNDLDEQVAYRILIQALEEPARTIAANAGYDAATVMADVDRAAPGTGFDAREGALVDIAQAGILDVAAAQKAAVRMAVAGAATALTVDTVVYKRAPEAVAGRP